MCWSVSLEMLRHLSKWSCTHLKAPSHGPQEKDQQRVNQRESLLVVWEYGARSLVGGWRGWEETGRKSHSLPWTFFHKKQKPWLGIKQLNIGLKRGDPGQGGGPGGCWPWSPCSLPFTPTSPLSSHPHLPHTAEALKYWEGGSKATRHWGTGKDTLWVREDWNNNPLSLWRVRKLSWA